MRPGKIAFSALALLPSPRAFCLFCSVFFVLTVALPDIYADQADIWVSRLGSPDRVEQARDQLRELGDRAIPSLLKGLKSLNVGVRAESAFVLGRIGSPRAVDPLVQALSDPASSVREKAAYALGELADPRALSALILLLDDKESPVRANAAFALGRIGSDKATVPLCLALLDRDVQVRNQTASALGFLNDKRALAPLVWLLKNEKSSEVRALAASSLANLRDARAVVVLVSLLDDPDVLIRSRAIDGLYQLTAQKFDYDPRQSDSARAPAVARWKSWFARNRDKLGAVDPVNPESLKPPAPAKPKPVKPEPAPPKPAPDPIKPAPLAEPAKPAPTAPEPVKPVPPQPQPAPPAPEPVQPVTPQPSPAPSAPEPVKPVPSQPVPAPSVPEPVQPIPVPPQPVPPTPEPVKPMPPRPEPAPIKPVPPQPDPIKPIPPAPEPINPIPPSPKPIEPVPPAPEPAVPDAAGRLAVPVIVPVVAGPLRSDALPADLAPDRLLAFNRALALYDAARFAEAAEDFQALLAALPDSVPVLYDLALAQQRLSLDEPASKTCLQVLALDPLHRPALNNLGVLRARAGLADAASDCFLRALKADPDHPDLLAVYNLADLLFKARSFQGAAIYYELLWDHRDRLPDSIPTDSLLFRRMQCSLALDRIDGLDRLFALEGPPPDDPALLRAHAAWRFVQADYPGALRSLTRALRVARNDADTVDSLARFYLEVPDRNVRNPRESIVLAEQAVRANPASARYWWTLLDASLANQRTLRAVQALAAASALDARPQATP